MAPRCEYVFALQLFRLGAVFAVTATTGTFTSFVAVHWPGAGRAAGRSSVLHAVNVAEASLAQRLQAPLYSFARGDMTDRASALASFERIDDVIMGGLSTSRMELAEAGFASWRGLVRTDGGGFCGQRTRTFETPLNLSGAKGIYITCRLASDDDVARRAWKLALRTDASRGEVVYQAPFVPPPGGDLQTIYVPFSDFRLVRGPVAVPDAAPLTASGVEAVYQLGFTASKFVIGERMTPLDGFRNGSFQLDIGELGAYAEGLDTASRARFEGTAVAPAALPEAEARRRRPFVEKLLRPVFRALFSEERRRKKRAAKLLTERGASKIQLSSMGWRFKRNLRGYSLAGTLLRTSRDAFAAAFGFLLVCAAKVTILPVFRLLLRRQQRAEERRRQAAAPANSAVRP